MNKKPFALLAICFILVSLPGRAQKSKEIYQLTVYHFTSAEQQSSIDQYLKDAYLPALHRKGIRNVGVFRPITNDTTADKRVYVLTPLKNIQEVLTMTEKLLKDQAYLEAGKAYLDAVYSNTPYARMENIILEAFPLASKMNLPKLNAPKQERIYELRSYEGPTEKYYRNKVEMFNQGGEIKLFERLNFNAVFYAQVIAGSRMPNLMYMTTFESREDRDAHWKTFGQDPEWKTLSGLPKYQKNVSKADIILMHPVEYSDF